MKNRNVNSIIGASKEVRKKYHDEYYKDYTPIEKSKGQRKASGVKSKKKVTEHTIQAKLVCIINPESGQIIRIRKNEIDSEINKKGWKSWEFTTKEAYKKQQSNNTSNKFKNLFDKVIKINLVKAFYATKTEKVAIKDKTSAKYGNKTKEIVGKSYNKIKYITKDEIIEVPITKKVKGDMIEVTRMKLVNKRTYVPGKGKNGKGKYITKKVLEEVTTKERAPSKMIKTTKKKKIKTLVEKITEVVAGKITIVKIPILTQAYKWVSTDSKKDCYKVHDKKIPIILYR